MTDGLRLLSTRAEAGLSAALVGAFRRALRAGMTRADLLAALLERLRLAPETGFQRALLFVAEGPGRDLLVVRSAVGFSCDAHGIVSFSGENCARRPYVRLVLATDQEEELPRRAESARAMEAQVLHAFADARLPLGVVALFDGPLGSDVPQFFRVSNDDPRRRALSPLEHWLDAEPVYVLPLTIDGESSGLVICDHPYRCTPAVEEGAAEGPLADLGLCAAILLERVLLAERLEEAETRYRKLIDGAPEGICLVDLRAGRVLHGNSAMSRLSGFCAGELAGLPLPALYRDEDLRQHQAILAELREAGQVVWPTSLRSRSGKEVWVELRAALIEDGPSELATFLYVDMTERREAEASVRAFARFALANPNLVFQLSAEGRLLFMNPAAYRFLANVQADAGESPRLVPECVLARVPALAAGGGLLSDVEHRVGDRVLSLTLQGVPEDGCVNGYGIDVTERKKLEERLARAQKMESLGTMAGSIAHDFGNVLSAILGHVSLLLERGGLDARNEASLRTIHGAAAKGATMTRQLRNFSRGEEACVRPIDLVQIVEETLSLLGSRFGDTVRVEQECAPDTPLVLADPSQMQSVILNLCINAQDAMPDGGTLSVSVTPVREPHDADGAAGAFVRLRIADTGIGMDEETRARLFEPFFTTKERGKGTGFGLATVYRIVTATGGHIEVTSEPGRGSCFDVYLPVCPEPLAEEPADGDLGALQGQETVLVCDDDDAVRGMAAEVLEMYGYRVLSARDGREALEQFDAHRDRIELALVDMVMPGPGGMELVRALRARNPEIKVVLCTGNAIEETAQGAHSEPVEGRLQKPYPVSRLAEVVRGALDNGRPAHRS